MARRPRPRDGVEPVLLDDEIVVLDSTYTTLHHLNVPAAMFWAECNGVRTLEAIVETIAAQSGHPRKILKDQVLALVENLVALGLLTLE
jgi:hypothetical protein